MFDDPRPDGDDADSVGSASENRAAIGVTTRFKPGQGGRPKGARNRFSGAFLAALEADFREHGAAAIARLRTKRPWDYLRLMVLVLPRRTEPEGSPFDGLSDETLVALCDQLAARYAAS